MLNLGVKVKDTNLKSSTLDLLDADHLQRQQLVQRHDGVHHHFGEEVLLTGDELGVQGCGGTLLQQLPLLSERREEGKYYDLQPVFKSLIELQHKDELVITYCLSSFFTGTAISLILVTARWVAVRNALMMV